MVGRAPTRVRWILACTVAPIALLTVIATALLWPRDPPPKMTDPYGLVLHENDDATVVEVTTRQCAFATNTCQTVTVELTSGIDANTTQKLTDMTLSPGQPPLQPGDQIVVSRDEPLVAEGQGAVSYTFADYQRQVPVMLLAAVFAILVVGVARWRGLAALAGLGVTYVVLFTFVIPALIRDTNPVAVALTGSTLIMFVVLYLAHGVSARTTTALLGTFASLILTGMLAWFFTIATHLTGAASEEATFIRSSGATFSLSGLLLAGVIIGSLGVLNDVTVTQASGVWEVHHANPERSVRSLYGSGMRIGRDHIASVVYTLVLAYAGATLPLLILFFILHQPASDVVMSEVVAEEVVRTLVGSIGLVLSVPITTMLAAVVVSRSETAGAVERAPHRRGPSSKTGAAHGREADAEDSLPQAPSPPDDQPPARIGRRARRERSGPLRRSWVAPKAERDFWQE